MTTLAVDRAPTPLSIFDSALRDAHAGRPIGLELRDERGGGHPLDVAGWCQPYVPGDRSLLACCTGPTLDIGCGPGRLTTALNRLGNPSLGIDISAAAVDLARARGAIAMRRNVFTPLPGHGRWRHILLADGNIGIGGDPAALLRRCRELLERDGRLHVELAPPGAGSWSGPVRLHSDDHPPSAPFRWASVAADDLAEMADHAALRVLATWTEAHRWFTTLTPA
jgi:SAM-dependent methyltransferase